MTPASLLKITPIIPFLINPFSLVKHLEAEGNELVSLEIATPSLEDVFIEMTGRRLRD